MTISKATKEARAAKRKGDAPASYSDRVLDGSPSKVLPLDLPEIRQTRKLIAGLIAGDAPGVDMLGLNLTELEDLLAMLGLLDRVDLLSYGLAIADRVQVWNVEFREWDDEPDEGWTLASQHDTLADAVEAKTKIGRRSAEVNGTPRRGDPATTLVTRVVKITAEVIK